MRAFLLVRMYIRAGYAQYAQSISIRATEPVYFTRARFSGEKTLTTGSSTMCEQGGGGLSGQVDRNRFRAREMRQYYSRFALSIAIFEPEVAVTI
jgi:hypothetical protein